MSRNILFLVTGMTPQIITETIWALACDDNAEDNWVPDEVHVLSTQDGLNQIRKRLFEDGVFEQFKKDYPILSHTAFHIDEHLHVITDQNKKPLIDLKTPEDNERSADIICQMVKDFTSMEDTSIHVSIAGGRKTMGFYAGYALSLYGRAQDSLSHVLVEEKFERAVDFFYPTPSEYLVSDRNKEVVGDAQEAQVWLAKIPFVRMRKSLSKSSQLNKLPFSEVVANINKSFEKITIDIDTKVKNIRVNGTALSNIPERSFAFFTTFAINAKQDGDGWMRPAKEGHISKQFLEVFNFIYDGSSSEIYFTQTWFDETKSELKKALTQNLGLDVADILLPQQQARNKPYKLNISAKDIHITMIKSEI